MITICRDLYNSLRTIVRRMLGENLGGLSCEYSPFFSVSCFFSFLPVAPISLEVAC